MLHDMVVRWQQAAKDNDLETSAEALGYTPHEIMTIASLIEAEGRGKYRAKIARVIYNRLEIEPNPAAGLPADRRHRQLRAGPRRHQPRLPTAETSSVGTRRTTPTSTRGCRRDRSRRRATSLDPGRARTRRTGPWLYYVTVNLETGETKFTDDYDEFHQFKQRAPRVLRDPVRPVLRTVR